MQLWSFVMLTHMTWVEYEFHCFHTEERKRTHCMTLKVIVIINKLEQVIFRHRK